MHCNADYPLCFPPALTDAIHRQRVRETEKRLIHDARLLKEVAELCGFNDMGYFRKIFRKYIGLRPGGGDIVKYVLIRKRLSVMQSTIE